MPEAPCPADVAPATRVLIVRIGAMGDVLHALAGVAALRAARPDWQIDWLVDERWRSLLEGDLGSPVVSTAIPLPIREWKRFPRSGALGHSVRELHGLRRHPYDLVIDMQGTLRSAVAGRLAGGKRLAGYADPRERPARLLYGRCLLREGAHVVEQGTQLLSQACGLPLTPGLPTLPTDTSAEHWAIATLAAVNHAQPLAVIAPSAGWPAKQWPAARFGELARELARQGWTVLVNNPGGQDRTATEVLETALHGGGDPSEYQIRGIACTVAEFTALLRGCSLLVGGDSGPTHLAAALGVPLVALFGPTDPARNGPWGPGPKRVLRHRNSVTSYRHVPTPDPGLLALSVEEVLEAVHALR